MFVKFCKKILVTIIVAVFTHFIDSNVGGDEYTYDTEGRMQTDINKGLSFEYNHLDLVQSAFEGTEEVKFTWDAIGRKLAKEVGGVTTYYFNGIEYTGPQFTHLATAEGAARNIDGLMNDGVWVYDYYLKDHLGNVRAVVTNENSLLLEEKVTMELAKRMLEDSNFDNVSATDQDKPYLYPYDPDDATNQKVSELSSYTGKIIGPAKVMSISAGEKIDLSTKYWYTEVPGDPLTNVTEILAGTLLNLGLASTGVIPSTAESGMALINNVSGSQFGALNSFIDDSFDNIDLSKPQAFIVYMTFDKEMNLDPINSGVIQVGEANSLGQLSQNAIAPKKDGYFYAYVTNRSSGKVNFDNMVIKRWKPNVRVTYDYYPYGLTWEDPKLPSDPEGIHDHCYQDKEFQWSEFTTGHGLALHDFHARMYDGATGRWLVPDPAAQFANPYLAMGNNPVVGVDPDGEFAFLIPIVAAAVFGAGNLAIQASNGEIDNFWDGAKAFVSGAIAGFAIGTGIALGLSVPILGTAIKTAGWIYAGSTVISGLSGLGHGIAKKDWSRLKNAGKIFLGNFYLDSDRNLFGQTWQGISRFSWELSQSTVGHAFSQLSNTFGVIDRVDYFGGATFSTRENKDSRWGVSIGNHINISIKDEVNEPFSNRLLRDPLFMHEYGHTFDSQIFGISYLFAIGIPSASGAEWTEYRANRHAERYFGNRYNVDWTPFISIGYLTEKP